MPGGPGTYLTDNLVTTLGPIGLVTLGSRMNFGLLGQPSSRNVEFITHQIICIR